MHVLLSLYNNEWRVFQSFNSIIITPAITLEIKKSCNCACVYSELDLEFQLLCDTQQRTEMK
jgi:hypothetical protein